MSSDQLIYEESATNETSQIPFSGKDYVYVLDSNNGSYAGSQVIIETSSLANMDRFANFAEAYISIPIVMTLNAPTAGVVGFGASNMQMAAALKAGYWNLIHSMSVDYNGTNVVQSTPYTNFHVAYKMVTTLSADDVNKYGPSLGYQKDSSMSFQWSPFNTPTTSGVGVSNNRNFFTAQPANAALAAQDTLNSGLAARQKLTAFDPTAAPWSTFMNASNANATGKDYYFNSATDTGFKAWYVIATIRLKDVSDFFAKMPLVKGASLRFTVNLNTSVSTITTANPLTLTSTPGGIQAVNGTACAMIASAAANNGAAAFPALVGNYQLAVSVARVQNSSLPSNGISHPTLNSCRLYVPMYAFTPEFASQYLSLGTKKKVTYNDLYQFTVSNVAGGGSFNQLITNGLPNLKKLIIIPFLSTSIAGSIAPYLSPFDSAPATTSPLAALGQLQVQVSGTNIWSMQQQYDWESFLHELSDSGINGGKTTGLCSGLLSALDFQTSYRYIVCDLGRRLTTEEGVPKSIQILGQNQSNQPLDLFVFVEYEKSLSIDVVTGQKLE